MRCNLCHLPLFLPWGICSQCNVHLPVLISSCRRCGLPMIGKNKSCYNCVILQPKWDHLIAVADYEHPFKKLIYQFKYNKNIELAFPLSRLMLMSWLNMRREVCLLKPDIVTCIPLYHSRYWSRGFNQSELLAKHIAHWMSVEFSPYLLNCRAKRRDQKKLSKRQRMYNSQQVFRCDRPLSGKSIAIIDDIVTTGNTINEACKQLKLQGAVNIQVICLCRTSL